MPSVSSLARDSDSCDDEVTSSDPHRLGRRQPFKYKTYTFSYVPGWNLTRVAQCSAWKIAASMKDKSIEKPPFPANHLGFQNLDANTSTNGRDGTEPVMATQVPPPPSDECFTARRCKVEGKQALRRASSCKKPKLWCLPFLRNPTAILENLAGNII